MGVHIDTGSNFANVRFTELAIYTSYSTVIGFWTQFTGTVVRENSWGSTTGKHMNALDGGSKEAKAARLPRAEFERRLAEVLKEHNL